jgi:hypothetical protein
MLMVLESTGVSIRKSISCLYTILFIGLRWSKELWNRKMLEIYKKLEQFSYNCDGKCKVSRKKRKEQSYV